MTTPQLLRLTPLSRLCGRGDGGEGEFLFTKTKAPSPPAPLPALRERGGRTLAALLFLLLAPALRAEDWPQWLGPNRNASSAETIAPWKELKVLWRKPVGDGHSSPVVAGGKVFVHGKVAGQDAEQLLCFDAATGEQLAASEPQSRGAFASPFGVGPRATPLVRGDRVYTLGVTGILAEHRLKSRQVTTATVSDLLKQFKAANLTFGVSASPLLDGDRLIALTGGPGASLVAFDLKDGKLAWQAEDDAASYASPVIIGTGAKRQLVALTAKGLLSLDPATGKQNWRFPFKDLLSESSTTPVQAGDLLIASSVTLGSIALKLTEKSGKPAVEEVWRNRELNCYFSTPVVVGKHLYLMKGVIGLRPSITLHCVDLATGKSLWTKPAVGKYHAALARTADNKLLMLDDAGRLTLIEPDEKGYRELSRSKICGETWTQPAISGGRIFVRDLKEVIALKAE